MTEPQPTGPERDTHADEAQPHRRLDPTTAYDVPTYPPGRTTGVTHGGNSATPDANLDKGTPAG